MAKSQSVTINILANGSKAQQQFRSVGAAAVAMGRQVEGVSTSIGERLTKASSKVKDFGQSMMSVGSKITAGVTIPIVAFGASAVKAFGEAQASEKQLADAFARFPALADTNVAAINRIAEAQMKRSRFDDDSIKSGAAVIAQYGATGKQIEQLIPLVVDYAAKTGRDVPAAAEIVGKALAGKGRALVDVGIAFKDAKSEAANYDQVMTGLGAKVKGFAETDAASMEGRLEAQRVKFGELREVIGAQLMPIFEQIAGVVARVADAFGNLSPHTQKMVVIGGMLAAALGPVVAILGALVTAIGALISPVGLVVVAIAALAAGVVYAYTHFKGFRDVVDGVMAWLRANVPVALEATRAAVASFIATVEAAWRKWGDDIKSVTSAVFNAIKPIVEGTLNATLAIIRAVLALIKGDWSGAWDAMKAAASAAWTAIKGVIEATITATKTIVTTGLTAMNQAAQAGFDALIAFVKTIPGKIKAALANLGNLLVSVGKDVMEGFYRGLVAGAGKVLDFAGSIATKVKDKIAGALKIFSPSKVMYELGRYTTDGLALGLLDGTDDVAEAAAGVADAVAGELGRIGSMMAEQTSAMKSAISDATNGGQTYIPPQDESHVGVRLYAKDPATGGTLFDSTTGQPIYADDTAAVEAELRRRGIGTSGAAATNAFNGPVAAPPSEPSNSVVVNVAGSVISGRDLVGIIVDALRSAGFVTPSGAVVVTR